MQVCEGEGGKCRYVRGECRKVRAKGKYRYVMRGGRV